MTNAEFKKYIEEDKIKPYEQELIDKLRSYNYKGIPLSIIVLCFDACNGNCYATSVFLTSGMDKFKLVHGNINIYPKNNYHNHSWIEKDDFVYDSTDGFKYEKELYYKLYEAESVVTYDEENCKNYNFYQDMIQQYDEANIPFLTIFLQFLEEEENKIPTINHNLLLKEIEAVRKKYNIIKRFNQSVMDEYRKEIEKQKIII